MGFASGRRLRIAAGLATVMLCVVMGACSQSAKEAQSVVVYTSADQVFAESVFEHFEEATGIRVLAVFDTEATKTTGLVNRIISEKNNPRADVFWNNEVFNTIRLKRAGILEPYVSPNAEDIPKGLKDSTGCWTGFAARLRVIVYNTEAVPADEAPRSIFELAEPKWRGAAAIAYPQFGTTLGHMGALLTALGDARFKEYVDALKANDVRLCDGNSQVRDLVGRGEMLVGLTDTDDVFVGKERGQPVEMVVPDRDGMGALVIPNTVMLIKGARHPGAARRFIDFLLSVEVEQMLAQSASGNIPVRSDVPRPEKLPRIEQLTVMDVNYNRVADRMQDACDVVKEVFAR